LLVCCHLALPLSKDVLVTRDTPDLAGLRREYETAGLDEQHLADDWPTQFGSWFADAIAARLPEPNAMTFATVDAQGRPSARTVLLKGYDEQGFVCYTNLRSRKATEALANPYASLVFCWLALHRQVVVCGGVVAVSRAETEAYFARRPRGAQLGAWASPQSQVIASRPEIEQRYAEAAARFPEGNPVPAPPHWGGLRIVPETVEFWQGRPDRLHDRLRFRRVSDAIFAVERLAP
jgi:pyridoxamine 5'-phosphate oxidase